MTGSFPEIGAAARIPNPALKLFEPFVGRWDMGGSHGQLPDVALHGHASFEWTENGAFLMLRTELDDARFPAGITIFGSDDVQHRYSALYFDQRGVSRLLQVTIEGPVLTWWRDQPGFSQRSTNTLSADGRTIVSRGELSKDGTTWEQDLELTFTRRA